METTLYISFLLVSLGLIIVPGPNVMVIVSTSLMHGRKRGLQTVAGTSLAMAIQLLVAAAGTTSFIHLVADGFSLLKWLGVAYLCYLGVLQFRQIFSLRELCAPASGVSTFSRGFVISLTNPKTILFFSAFLPQFVSQGGAYLQQLTVLSLSFLFLAVILDSSYAILASRLSGLLERRGVSRLQHGIGGLMLLGASAWLALSRRA